jgi:hypothetical protein
MTTTGEGPPNSEAGGSHGQEPPGKAEVTTSSESQSSDTDPREPGKTLEWVPCTWSYPQDLRSQLRRRRQAAARSVPLDCGCPDPWPCRCSDPPLTDAAVDGWRDAAEHVLAAGHMPLLPLEIRRALYRRGGLDRELAERLHRGCGQVAS